MHPSDPRHPRTRAGFGRLAPLLLLATLAASVTPAAGAADMEALTPDGRRVLLHEDGTWSLLETPAEGSTDHLTLEVESRTPLVGACRFGLRITNNLGYPLKNIVPQFSAYKADGVRYQTVFRDFSSVRPTDSQYREITFSGVTCEEIVFVQVSGADRCTMGELTKYSGEPGECLSHVRLVPSDLVRITK